MRKIVLQFRYKKQRSMFIEVQVDESIICISTRDLARLAGVSYSAVLEQADCEVDVMVDLDLAHAILDQFPQCDRAMRGADFLETWSSKLLAGADATPRGTTISPDLDSSAINLARTMAAQAGLTE